MTVVSRIIGVILVFSLTALSGCGAQHTPAMGDYVDVKGTVQVSGSPLKTGTIYFKKDGDAGRDEFVDVKDGAFALKMFVAKYKVAFDTETKKTTVPAKYRSFSTTDLSLEVKSGGVADASFKVQ